MNENNTKLNSEYKPKEHIATHPKIISTHTRKYQKNLSKFQHLPAKMANEVKMEMVGGDLWWQGEKLGLFCFGCWCFFFFNLSMFGTGVGKSVCCV